MKTKFQTPVAYICDGYRTPFGRYGGGLANIRTDDLAVLPIQALVKKYGSVDWSQLDEVILGCANQSGEDNRNVARMALLLAGLPPEIPGLTVNRLCASGLEAIVAGARMIKSQEAKLVIAGGVESMTRAPFVMGKSETAFGRSQRLEDTTLGWRFVNPEMKRAYGVDSMAETAERVATDYKVSRESQDAFAYRSHMRASAAQRDGVFAEQICAVELPKKKGQTDAAYFSDDEHIRADTTPAALAKLKGVVKPEGSVTAGNSSGINDGAAALLLASEESALAYGLKPLARLVGAAAAGVLPQVMGIGPVPAVRKLLALTGVNLAEVGVIELNEAFAAQAVAVLRKLGISEDAEFVNAHGGAIALGHPLGASGARLVLAAAHELHRRQERYAICTLCVGVGQGSAVLLERV